MPKRRANLTVSLILRCTVDPKIGSLLLSRCSTNREGMGTGDRKEEWSTILYAVGKGNCEKYWNLERAIKL